LENPLKTKTKIKNLPKDFKLGLPPKDKKSKTKLLSLKVTSNKLDINQLKEMILG
jgi:hypothetical protein